MHRIGIASVVVLLIVSGAASAGVLATDSAAYVDGTGRAWSGSTDLDSGIMINGIALKGTVDWCVYAPGSFHFTGYTPTAGEFVYAYQIELKGTSVAELFTVAMLDGNKANNIGSFDLTGDRTPNGAYFENPGHANLLAADFEWAPGLTPGQKTAGLVFSSINAPLDWVGTLTDSGQAADGWVPSPSNVIPEPATMGLLAVGMVVGLLRRKR